MTVPFHSPVDAVADRGALGSYILTPLTPDHERRDSDNTTMEEPDEQHDR